MNVLAITPIKEEFSALADAFRERGLEGHMVPLGRVNGMSFDNGRIQLAQGGLGKAQFGVQTQHLIDQADNIGLVVCAGIAGSLVSSVSVGDVVVATATIEHDFN